MPTLEDGEFTLGESLAIQRYTLAKAGVDSDFYPSEPAAAAKVDQVVLNAANNVSKPAGAILFAVVYGPLFFGKDPVSDEKK